MPSKSKEQVPIRFLIVGDARVGKSTLIKSYSRSKFIKKVPGVVPSKKQTVMIEELPYDIMIVDTDSQEVDKTIRKKWYDGIDIVLVCYNVKSKKSYEYAKKLMEEAWNNTHKKPIFFVGLQKDLRDGQKGDDFIYPDEATRFAKTFGQKCFDVSAKEKESIHKVIEAGVHEYVQMCIAKSRKSQCKCTVM